jgi:hypothetical protein
MRNENIKYVTILHPKFDRAEQIYLGLNKKYLAGGPFYAIKQGYYFAAFAITFASIFSFGFFWIYYAFQANKIDIRRKISSGYKAASKEDLEIIETFLKVSSIQIDEIKFSRLGTAESNFLNKIK